MGTQFFDSNKNPVTSTDAVGSHDQQVSDRSGVLINPAREDGNLSSLNSKSSGQVDANNSTSTPLIGNATFTGIATDVLNVSMVAIQVRTDQVSATGGMSVQWSPDGTNWDDDDTFTIPSNNGKFFTFGPQARYFRVVYTNGAVTQTVFRLHTTLKPFAIKPSSHRVSSSIADDDDSELTKAVITGKASDGSYQNARMTTNGSLYMAQLQEGELERGTLFLSNINRDSVGLILGVENVALLKNESAAAIRVYAADLAFPANSEWELYLNPTTSANGTVRTNINLRTDSSTTSLTKLYDSPTVTTNGTFMYGFQISSSIRSSVLPGTIILGVGHSLLFKRTVGGAGSRIHLNVSWGTNNV